MHLFVYLSISIYIYIYIPMSLYIYIYHIDSSVYLSIYIYIILYHYHSLSTYLSTCLSLSGSVKALALSTSYRNSQIASVGAWTTLWNPAFMASVFSYTCDFPAVFSSQVQSYFSLHPCLLFASQSALDTSVLTGDWSFRRASRYSQISAHLLVFWLKIPKVGSLTSELCYTVWFLYNLLQNNKHSSPSIIKF